MNQAARKRCPKCGQHWDRAAMFCNNCGSPLRADDPAPAGGALGNMVLGSRFTVQSVIGKGGMGTVFLGMDRFTGGEVAIKTLNEQYVRQPAVKARFISEAKLLFNVSHENIVNFLGYVEEQGYPFLIMEFVRGRTITKAVEDAGQPMDSDRLVTMAAQVLAGLHYLHTLPTAVLHRDVKPDNIVFVDGETVKLIDFGIAKVSGNVGMTMAGVPVGTREFMAPEQVIGKSETLTPACDQYAMGITMYYMACGRVPFQQQTDGGFEVLKAHTEELPPDPRSFSPKVPDFLAEVILKTLAKKPEDRYPSCLALKHRLEAGVV